MQNDRYTKASPGDISQPAHERICSKDLTKPYCTSRFFAQLYSLFGAPSSIFDEGFSYLVRDAQRNEYFWAELTGFGPGYFGNPASETTREAIRAFDAHLETVVLKDCRIEVATDFGRLILGARNGVPFEEEILEE